MNRQQMRAELSFILGVREGEADQDFQTSRLNSALDRAYERVVLDGKMHGMGEHFVNTQLLIWPASALTVRVPDVLNGKVIRQIYDLSEGEPGFKLYEGKDYYWADRRTLQWGSGDTGPNAAADDTEVGYMNIPELYLPAEIALVNGAVSSSVGDDLLLRFEYLAAAEPLLADASEPLLVPAEHRMLIVWEAACNLRGIADDQVPGFWFEQKMQARTAYIKHVSRPKPTSALVLATSSLYEDDY